MAKKLTAINCQVFKAGCCYHHGAPRQLIGMPDCILAFPPKDPRLPAGCVFQVPHTRPMNGVAK